jgi:hypothetical protein
MYSFEYQTSGSLMGDGSVIFSHRDLLFVSRIGNPTYFKNKNSPEYGARILFTRFHPTCPEHIRSVHLVWPLTEPSVQHTC